jgi:hypothetical protein
MSQNITKPIEQSPSREPDIYSADEDIHSEIFLEDDLIVQKSTPHDPLPSPIY